MRNKKYICENEKLMKEWDWNKNQILGLDPTKITYGSSTKVWWKCEKGHEWEATIISRNAGSGCPICSKKKR